MTASPPSTRRALAVFTRDLRVHDNPVLALAQRYSAEILPLFVVDPSLPSSPNRRHYLHGCLEDLRGTLRARGGDLVLRYGDMVDQVTRLAAEVQAERIVVAADTSGYARRRHRRLDDACKAQRISLETPVSSSVVAAGQLAPANGDHYKVFTPYWRVWTAQPWRPVAPTPRRIRLVPGIEPGAMPALGDLTAGLATPALPAGGERAARTRMFRWLGKGVAGYEHHHDDLARAGTSQLSAALHFGCLSPLELASRARAAPGGEPYARQLCWRDFFAQVNSAFPDMPRRDYRPRGRRWRDDDDALAAWKEGQTGYPIIDAGMRQLATEGFMHNRARLLTASFLTKQLGVYWREGAEHFASLLVDADVASNSGNWQWVAGTGNDTRPNRTFNPMRQAIRFDPDGIYVRRYLPELRDLPGRSAHEPWVSGRPAGYPAPLIDPGERTR